MVGKHVGITPSVEPYNDVDLVAWLSFLCLVEILPLARLFPQHLPSRQEAL